MFTKYIFTNILITSPYYIRARPPPGRPGASVAASSPPHHLTDPPGRPGASVAASSPTPTHRHHRHNRHRHHQEAGRARGCILTTSPTPPPPPPTTTTRTAGRVRGCILTTSPPPTPPPPGRPGISPTAPRGAGGEAHSAAGAHLCETDFWVFLLPLNISIIQALTKKAGFYHAKRNRGGNKKCQHSNP